MSMSNDNFVKQVSFEVEYAPASITNWRSRRTGLQLTYINQLSPVVNGYFVVATEIEDDSGCPHTLEHLVFMGSKKYPYKGLLDSLSNRFFSSTNAWTSVDQTVYTLTTAGWEGFRTLLPVYLDHLFNPTLTEEACLTEVYHIDGDGKEKGVVFSEMQGIENQSWFVTYMNMQKALYAKNSGYSSETGGLMSELRQLSNDKIREFHNKMYRPDNLNVILTGTVDEKELLSIMNEFDKELPSLPETTFKRPFVDSPHDEPLAVAVTKNVEFAEKDTSMGELIVSWIGPLHNENLKNAAVDIVGTFFTDSAISLLKKNLIEIENPLATDIDYSTDDYYRTALNFTVSGVPTDRLEEANQKIKSLIASQISPESLDINYLREILRQQKLKFIHSTEKSPTAFTSIAISTFIYGKINGSDLKNTCMDLKEFDELEKWTPQQWCDLIKEQFVDNKSATVIGRPSVELYRRQKLLDKENELHRRTELQDEGLDKLAEKLKYAQEKNDRLIPSSLLTQFGKPDPKRINFISTKSYKGGLNDFSVDVITNDNFDLKLRNDCPKEFPMAFHFEEFKSRFTTINLIMSSKKARPELLPYMALLEEIFSFALQLPDGTYVPYDKVVSEISNDLIEFLLDNGFEHHLLELVSIKVQFENANYEKAIGWLLKIMKFSLIEEKRVKIIAEKIVNSLNEKKRSADLMMYSAQYRYLFNDFSLRKAHDSINNENFYRSILEKIDNGEFEEIRSDIMELRDLLFDLDNIKVFIMGGVNSNPAPLSSWSTFLDHFKKNLYNPELIKSFPRSCQFKSLMGENCSKDAVLVSVPASESSHLIASTPIPTNYLDEDIFNISLVCEYLAAVEGPFWRGIRGAGLAYGASVRHNLDTGFLNFVLYRASDVKLAWIAAKEIVGSYTLGAEKFERIHIENAIATIVEEIANAQSNSYDAATNKILDNIFKGRGPNFVKFFLEKLNRITADDLLLTTNKYFKPLFTSEGSVLFASIPPSKVDELESFLSAHDYNVMVEQVNSEDNESEADDDDYCSSDERSSDEDNA